MIFDLTKNNDIKKLIEFLLESKNQSVEVKIHKNTRTSRQNRSMHLYFTLVAEEANNAGYEMRDLVLDNVPIRITLESVKELWKIMQKTMYGTTSTTQLKTNQVSEIYDAMNVVISERLKLSIPFPSWDYNDKRGYK